MVDRLIKSGLPKIIDGTIWYKLKNTFADVRFNNGKGEKL